MVDLIAVEELIFLTLLNAIAGTWLLFFLMRKSVKNTVFQWISEYKNLFLDEIAENPKIIAQIVSPALKGLAKEYGIPEPGGKSGTVNLFGLRIPRELVDIGLGMIMPRAREAAIAANPFE